MTDQQGWGPPQQQPWSPWEPVQQPSGAPPWGQQPNGAPPPWQGPSGAPPWQHQPYGGPPREPGHQPYAGQSPQPGGPQYTVPQPNPGGPPGRLTNRPRKRHRVRNVLLAIFALIVVIVVISTTANSGKKPAADNRPAATATTKAAPKSSPTPSFTAAENAWITQVVNKWPQISAGTDNQIVTVGNDICNARQAGTTQQQLVAASGARFGKQAKPFVRAAEAALCPSEIPVPPKVLLNFSGSGIENSAPFTVGSQETVNYSFNCSSFGQSGNFAADLEYGNQASLNSDDQPIANQLAPSGQATTTVYPQDPGQQYYVSVDSECSWTVQVVEP
jgi:hypothetical protein